MQFLRQNTAVIITVGPFYDKADGVTIETGLTITNERITMTADTDAGSAPTNILDNVTGATSGTDNDLNYITGNDAGMMQLELSAANTNRVGRMLLSITDAANHVPVFAELFVLPQAIFDWLTGVIVPLPANVTTWLGTAAATPTVAGVPEVDLTHVAGATTDVSVLATNVAAILVDTAVIGATGAGLTSLATAAELAKVPKSDGTVSWNATALGAIQSEANDALVAYDPPTKAELDAAVANVSVDEIQATALADFFNTDSGTTYGAAVAGSVVKEIADNAGGSALTVQDIVDGVWNEDATAHQSQGTFGQAIGDPVADTNTIFKAVVTDAAGATVGADTTAILEDTGTTLQAELDGIQADTENIQTRLPAALVSGRIDASVGAMEANVLTATAIADNAITAAKIAAAAISAAKFAASAIDANALATDAANEIAGKVWDKLTADHLLAGSFGLLLGDQIAGETGLLPIFLDASISSRATPAQVNAEVVDGLNVDTYAEPGQATPAATASLAVKLNYLYKAWRNKKDNDGAVTQLYADDATTVDQKQTTSEAAGVVTKGEWATGP